MFQSNGVTLHEETFAELVEAAQSFLRTKLYTKAEVEQIVLAQEKERCPWLVREKQGEVSIPKHQAAFREYSRKLGTAEFLDVDDAQKRTAICLGCPKNVVCQIDEEAERLLYLLARGRSANGLGWCVVHGHHNAIACQIDKKATPDEQQPKECWVLSD